jgi:hypothetical protein
MSESRSVKTGGFGHDFRLGFRHRTDMYDRGFLSKGPVEIKIREKTGSTCRKYSQTKRSEETKQYKYFLYLTLDAAHRHK